MIQICPVCNGKGLVPAGFYDLDDKPVFNIEKIIQDIKALKPELPEKEVTEEIKKIVKGNTIEKQKNNSPEKCRSCDGMGVIDSNGFNQPLQPHITPKEIPNKPWRGDYPDPYNPWQPYPKPITPYSTPYNPYPDVIYLCSSQW